MAKTAQQSKKEKSESNEAVDSKKRATGIKEQAGNMAAVKEVKETKEEKFKYPQLFVSDDERVKVGVDILFDPATGRPLLMLGSKEETSTQLKFLNRTHEWAEFSHPSYDDVVAYREASMTWDNQSRQFLSDPVKMRLHYIRYHLKAWSLQNNGKPVELEFARDGAELSQDCMNRIGKVTPSLMDLFLTEFERETMLG